MMASRLGLRGQRCRMSGNLSLRSRASAFFNARDRRSDLTINAMPKSLRRNSSNYGLPPAARVPSEISSKEDRFKGRARKVSRG